MRSLLFRLDRSALHVESCSVPKRGVLHCWHSLSGYPSWSLFAIDPASHDYVLALEVLDLSQRHASCWNADRLVLSCHRDALLRLLSDDGNVRLFSFR